ncbi:hypothetical protein LOZ58_000691 [Ophidiomyces ophidiicola]|nr:hypothetical protein LOZ58_000691 [Ophidiomyces ophidiicola]
MTTYALIQSSLYASRPAKMPILNPTPPKHRENNNTDYDLGPPTIPSLSHNVDCSDIVDGESDAAIDVMDVAEQEMSYCVGPVRYYPLRIGEVLNQRYRIDHKIDHGGFSTVWLAHDLKHQTDVAIKVMIRYFRHFGWA